MYYRNKMSVFLLENMLKSVFQTCKFENIRLNDKLLYMNPKHINNK